MCNLGEVGILGTALLRIYSGTLLPIFIEIGSYLTDKEQKNKLEQFFETRSNNNNGPKTVPCGTPDMTGIVGIADI